MIVRFKIIVLIFIKKIFYFLIIFPFPKISKIFLKNLISRDYVFLIATVAQSRYLTVHAYDQYDLYTLEEYISLFISHASNIHVALKPQKTKRLSNNIEKVVARV